MRFTVLIFALLLLIPVFTCKSVTEDGDSSSGGTIDEAANACGGETKGCVIGNVFDADSGGVVSNVVVSAGGQAPSTSLSKDTGTVVATANAEGWFLATGIEAASDVTLCFQHDDYATLCRNFEIIAQSTLNLPPILMTLKSTAQSIDSDTGGTVSDSSSGAELVIAAGTVCQADGTTQATGDISCSLTALSGVDSMPGYSIGVRTSSTEAAIMAGGMMEISCEDGSGNSLELCTGQTATARIPIWGYEECGDLATPVQSWRFNDGTGLWNEYGTFTKNCGGDALTSYYEGTVDSLGWWAAAWPNGFTCLTGTVVDTVTEEPNSEALIECDASVSQEKVARGVFASMSDADGDFCVRTAVATYYSCVAQKAQFTSNTQVGDAPVNELECGHIACTDVGGFSLEDPILRTTLTWDGEATGVPRDLDSYFISSDGSLKVYYGDEGSLTGSPFIELDTDAVSWSGPENMTVVPGVFPGTYRFCVHNFSEDGDLTTSGAETLVSGLGVALPKRYHVPTSPVNRIVWQVYEVVIDEDYSMTLTDLNVLAGGIDDDEVDVCLQ